MQTIFDVVLARARTEAALGHEASAADAAKMQLLTVQAPELLPFVEHERVKLAGLLAQHGRACLEDGRFAEAESWLQAGVSAIEGATAAGNVGSATSKSSAAPAAAMRQKLLLSLATCVIEQLALQVGGGKVMTPLAAAAALRAAAYVHAAAGEGTTEGRTALSKASALTNRPFSCKQAFLHLTLSPTTIDSCAASPATWTVRSSMLRT